MHALYTITQPTFNLYLSGEYECEQSNLLKNTYIQNADISSPNVKIIADVSTMGSCADLCCQRDECDVAMVKNEQCHLVGCPNDQSCQMEHSEDSNSELMFLTGRKKKRQGDKFYHILLNDKNNVLMRPK